MIIDAGDPNLLPTLGIPRSTAMSWIKKGLPQIVTLASLEVSSDDLILENQKLRKELDEARATQKLQSFTFKLFGLQIQFKRLPSPDTKSLLLSAIRTAKEAVSLSSCLEAIGLSGARYYSWLKRQKGCELEDNSTCPRLSPTKISTHEIAKIKEYVTSESFAHFSIQSLAWYTKRCDELFISASSWYRVIKYYGLMRPLKRVYPPKPKVGIRASKPNEIWHLDMSVIKLTDGTRCFIQAIRGNFSRYIIAHAVSPTYGGLRTKELLTRALEKAGELNKNDTPMVMVDSGSENLNANVDQLIEIGDIDRVVAQIDIEFSNSMIEAVFRRLKHNYLFKQRLDTLQILTDKTDFYILQSNEVIPHSALEGGTPLEVFTGTWTEQNTENLKEKNSQARSKRIKQNRNANCGICPALSLAS